MFNSMRLWIFVLLALANMSGCNQIYDGYIKVACRNQPCSNPNESRDIYCECRKDAEPVISQTGPYVCYGARGHIEGSSPSFGRAECNVGDSDDAYPLYLCNNAEKSHSVRIGITERIPDLKNGEILSTAKHREKVFTVGPKAKVGDLFIGYSKGLLHENATDCYSIDLNIKEVDGEKHSGTLQGTVAKVKDPINDNILSSFYFTDIPMVYASITDDLSQCDMWCRSGSLCPKYRLQEHATKIGISKLINAITNVRPVHITASDLQSMFGVSTDICSRSDTLFEKGRFENKGRECRLSLRAENQGNNIYINIPKAISGDINFVSDKVFVNFDRDIEAPELVFENAVSNTQYGGKIIGMRSANNSIRARLPNACLILKY